MKSLFKKINDLLGLTRSESVVFWFLIFAFASGLVIKFVHGDVIKDAKKQKFDYSVFDSEFEKRSAEIEKYISGSGTTAEASATETSGVSFKININTATKEELMKLPEIGEKTAESIIRHRQTYGKFERIEDIMNVRGIGQKKFEKIKRYLTTK